MKYQSKSKKCKIFKTDKQFFLVIIWNIFDYLQLNSIAHLLYLDIGATLTKVFLPTLSIQYTVKSKLYDHLSMQVYKCN